MTEYTIFDVADYLDSEEMIAGFLAAAAEDPNPEVLLYAIGAVARARGMAKIASETGLGRESLYKTFAPGAHPRFETVQRVLKALGVRTTFIPNEFGGH
jgi:probable addiction module antidote protein